MYLTKTQMYNSQQASSSVDYVHIVISIYTNEIYSLHLGRVLQSARKPLKCQNITFPVANCYHVKSRYATNTINWHENSAIVYKNGK